MAQTVKRLSTMWETQVQSLGQEDPLEKEMATHSSILAWRIPWTEEPDGLQSMGSQRVNYDKVTNTLTFTQSFSLFLNGSYSMYSCVWLLSFVLMSVIVIQVSVSVYCVCVLSCLSHIQLFVTPWTVAHQAPLSMGFSRQEYWSGLPFLPPGDLPDPGIEPTSLTSPTLTAGFSTTSIIWEAPKGTKMGEFCL